MGNNIINKENKKIHRHNFVEWMNKNYPDIQRPEIMVSNVMLSVNNQIGFSINDLITGAITLDNYEKKYIEYFESINRKSPKGHAGVQRNNAVYFLEYFNEINK